MVSSYATIFIVKQTLDGHCHTFLTLCSTCPHASIDFVEDLQVMVTNDIKSYLAAVAVLEIVAVHLVFMRSLGSVESVDLSSLSWRLTSTIKYTLRISGLG